MKNKRDDAESSAGGRKPAGVEMQQTGSVSSI